MKKFREFLSRIFEQWISSTVLGILVVVGSSTWIWVSDFLFSPPYDVVYTFEKKPNPLKVVQERMHASMQGVLSEMKKAKLSSYNEKEASALLAMIPKVVELQSEEINADQMHMWILNLGRLPLEDVSITFQNCTGYVRLEASPLALGPADGATPATTISSNGVVYRYGKMRPESGAFVKAGFNDIHNCSAAIDARRSDSQLATSKYVTSDEYNRYGAALRPDRAKFASYLVTGIGVSVGVLLIWFGFVYRRINQRLLKLERPSSRNR